jgi:hypothetical protein
MGKLKLLKISFKGSNRGIFEKETLNNFLTVQPIFTSNLLIDSARQVEDSRLCSHQRCSEFHSTGATGEFHQKNPQQ